jgi:sigma-E factor negative regulatory protein RseC
MLGEALSPAPAPASNRVLAQDDLGVSVGDEVLFGIPENGALHAALVMYGVPLLGLMLGVVLTQAWGDGWAGLSGLLGLGLGLLLVRLWPYSRSVAVRPLILERLPSAPSALTDMKIFPMKSL